jgi:hypothetical protein
MLPSPELIILIPDKGPKRGGNEVHLLGKNFAQNCQINWDDCPLEAHFYSSCLCECIAPAFQKEVLVPVCVRNPDRKRSKMLVYTYTNDTASESVFPSSSILNPQTTPEWEYLGPSNSAPLAPLPEALPLPSLQQAVQFARYKRNLNGHDIISEWMSSLSGKM